MGLEELACTFHVDRGYQDLREASSQPGSLGELVRELLTGHPSSDALATEQAAEDLGLEVGGGLPGDGER